MSKISAVIIAKDEEEMIRGAIESLSFCDEIIVIDNGSKDRTKEISENLKARVYEVSTDDFSEIRNYGLNVSTNEWILYLDADERLDENLQEVIKKTISESTEYSAFRLKRKNYYLGKNEWPYIEKLERLFKKESLKKWYGELHESPEIEGKVGILEGYILHFTHRNLESMLEKTIEWSKKEALLRFNSNHPKMSWWRFPRVMISAFLNSFIRQGGYKAGAMGLIESMYQSFSMFITYARLWELQRITRKKI